jgi:membrane protease YdiL (CAAX protease family)
VLGCVLSPDLVHPVTAQLRHALQIQFNPANHLIPAGVPLIASLLSALTAAIVAVALVLLLSRFAKVAKRDIRLWLLLGRDRAVRKYAPGLAAGGFLMCVVMACIYMCGAAKIGMGVAPVTSDAITLAFAFVVVGLAEEMLWRGYLLVSLTQAMGFSAASVATSTAFTFAHYVDGDGWQGLIQVFLFGLTCCWLIRATGSLWFAAGFHAAWDYVQSGIFGVSDSGFLFTGYLLRTRLEGAEWITGGSSGPEGSAITVTVYATVLLWLIARSSSEIPKR